MTERERILVVGGVAGGASAAARTRRLDENAEIIIFDKGPYVSFANCGLPYHVGEVIPEEASLLVATPKLFSERFDIEVRTMSEVVAIDREAGEIEVREVETGRIYREPYTKLVLSMGARAIRPPLPGIDLPGIFVLRTIPDSRKIKHWLHEHDAKHAVVVGAGFIGLEMTENFKQLGIDVTLVELADQVLPPLDPDMARAVEEQLLDNDIDLVLGDGVASFENVEGERLKVSTNSGREIETDIVILAIGIRPEVGLAEAAGLEIGKLGGIKVDASMRTNDPAIFAVGDAVEVIDHVTGEQALIPLAGPANRQGRIAADAITGHGSRFRGVQGTAVCGVFDLTIASTGASVKTLEKAGRDDHEVIYLHPGHHVGYYPGATPIHLKLVFSKRDGQVLGAQAIGEHGIARRIDVIAMAIQLGGTVHDLAAAELCYAPQFGAAKDPVNLAGMIAVNVLNGLQPLAHWPDLGGSEALLVDVREKDEHERETVPGSLNIPLTQLRDRLDELPKDRELLIYCHAGQRAYYAVRTLMQKGYDCRNLSGGIQTWQMFRPREG